MRRLRWLLPVAILAIVVAVASIYVERKESLANAAPNRPHPLEEGVHGRAVDWCYTQSQGDQPRVDICAAKLNEVDGVKQLEGAQIKLYHDSGSAYDLVESDLVRFYEEEKKLYSEGDVEITLAVPADESALGARLLRIHSSGVEFAADTGMVFTDRPVSFEFEQGGGSALGAFYDPSARELRLNKDVSLDWRGKDPTSPPIHIEAGQAWYYERESKVLLYPWSRLRRAALSLDADASEVLLDKGVIRRADVRNGRGTQKGPTRTVDFGAEQLHLNFTPKMAIETINAQSQTRLVSTADASRTTVTADRMDLTFSPNGSDSTLNLAVASGKSRVESAPVARRGADPPETRVLRSEVVRLFMRPGGEEIERVVTDGPGTIDFLPNRPAQLKRTLSGDRIWIDYGAGNRVRQFRATNASTRTEHPGGAPTTTSSKEIIAAFDAGTGELARLEHNTDFRYAEGDSTASADRAVQDQAQGIITLHGSAKAGDARGSMAGESILLNQTTHVVTLQGGAHAKDASGSLDAARIVMDRNTGDYTAEGGVTMIRQPDGKGQSSAMLSTQEILQATAQHMTSSEGNQKIHYEGGAKLWQGASRIEADRIDIDRAIGRLDAHGHVTTQFADRTKTPVSPNSKRKAAVFTIVHAADLAYSDVTREAHYQNGVQLERPGLTVDSKDLRAFLTDSTEETSLDKAFATGAVKIVATDATAKGKRTRTGTSERAEYYAAEQKVILSGGQPKMVDSAQGSTTGEQLTWWADDDRFDVIGGEDQPAQSIIRKK